MRAGVHKILVTGGAGFIGSAFVRLAAKECPRIVVVDKLTYAGDLARLAEAKARYKFFKADICDLKKIERVFRDERPKVIVHFAAETHVDRSIVDSTAFIRTNITGTKVLLDLSRKYGVKKFLHISTDEVYGDIEKGRFTESCALKPNSPYAASKAAADLLIRSYIRTYAFPAIIIRPSNNYGPWQYPEKLIPLAIVRLLQNRKVPVYARGTNVREWLFVEDCAKGIMQILKKGRPGEVYNLGSGEEKSNIAVIRAILKSLKRNEDMIEFVKDRPGHDVRYSLDSGKLLRQAGWQSKVDFAQGIRKTISWCLANQDWLLSKHGGILPIGRTNR